MFRLVNIDRRILFALIIDDTILERDLVLLLVHRIANAQLLKAFSLEVFFVDALDQVFALLREELSRLLVKVLLHYV